MEREKTGFIFRYVRAIFHQDPDPDPFFMSVGSVSGSAVLWIRFILIRIRIRIRGSGSDDYGSGSGSNSGSGSDSGSGSWPNLDKNSKIQNSSAFFWKKNFVDFLCLSKNALNTQILEHLEEIS